MRPAQKSEGFPTTPLIKVNRTKSYGAEVVLYGDVYDLSLIHISPDGGCFHRVS